ncbi:hypothetical protein OC861_000795 [Tilletia horrida]|nr:hypothetical protein OC861_000795 [Tilletia horrida]
MSQLDELLASAPFQGGIDVDPLETPRGLASPAVVDYVSQQRRPSSASYTNGGTSPPTAAAAPPGRKTLTLLSGNRFIPSSTANGSHNATSPSISSLATFTNSRGLNGSVNASQNSSFNTSQNRLSTASIAHKPAPSPLLSTGRLGARAGEQDSQAGPAQYSHSLSFSATASPRYQHGSSGSWAVTGSHLLPYAHPTRGLPAASSSGVRTDAASEKYFITVLPPPDYPMDTVTARRGTLVPLYPTLSGQLYAIARELSLPSVGGIALYLQDDGEGNPGPKVGDRSWSGLWKRHFDEEEAERAALEAQRTVQADAQSVASRDRSDASWHRRKRPNGHTSMSGADVRRSLAEVNGINNSPTYNSVQDSLLSGEDEEHLADMPGPNGQMYADADETGLSSGLSNSGAELDGSSSYDVVSSRGSLGFRRQRSSVSTRRNTNGGQTGVRKDSLNSAFSQDGRSRHVNNRHMRQASSRGSTRAREVDVSTDLYSSAGAIPIEAESRHSSLSLNAAQPATEFVNMRSPGGHHSPRASLFQAQSQARMYSPMSNHVPGLSASLTGPGSGLRLPIVARFEWTVERSRPAAAWWDIWCERERARINQNAPPSILPISAPNVSESIRVPAQHQVDVSEKLTAPRELSTTSVARISPQRGQQTPGDTNDSSMASRAHDPYTPDVSVSQRQVHPSSISRVLAQNFAAPPPEPEEEAKAAVQPTTSSASSRWSAVSSQREVPSDRSFEAEADTPSTTLQEVKTQAELSLAEESERSRSGETIGAGVEVSIPKPDQMGHELPFMHANDASRIALRDLHDDQHMTAERIEETGTVLEAPTTTPIHAELNAFDAHTTPLSTGHNVHGEGELHDIHHEQDLPASSPFEDSHSFQPYTEQNFDDEHDFEAYTPHFQGHPSIELTASSTTNSIQVHSPTYDHENVSSHPTVVTSVDLSADEAPYYHHQDSPGALPSNETQTIPEAVKREEAVVSNAFDNESHVMAEIVPAPLLNATPPAVQSHDITQHDSTADYAQHVEASTTGPVQDLETKARIASSGWTSEPSPNAAPSVTRAAPPPPPPPRPQRAPPPPPPRRQTQELKSRFVAPSHSPVQEIAPISSDEITAESHQHGGTPSAPVTDVAGTSGDAVAQGSEYSRATVASRNPSDAPSAVPEQPTLLMQHVFGLFSDSERIAEPNTQPSHTEHIMLGHKVEYGTDDATEPLAASDAEIYPQQAAGQEAHSDATELSSPSITRAIEPSDVAEPMQETMEAGSIAAEDSISDPPSGYATEQAEASEMTPGPVAESFHQSAAAEVSESPTPHRALERISILSSRPGSILSMESKGSDSTVRASFVDAPSHMPLEPVSDELHPQEAPAEREAATGPPLPPRSPMLSQEILETTQERSIAAPLLPPRPVMTPQTSDTPDAHSAPAESPITVPPVPPRPPFISHDSLAQLDVFSQDRQLPVEPLQRQPRPYLRYDDVEPTVEPVERTNEQQSRPYLRFDDVVAEDEDSDSSGEHTPTHDDPDEDEEQAVSRRNAAIEARLAARNQDRSWASRPTRGFFNFGFKRRLSPAGLEEAKSSSGVPLGGQGFDDDSSDEDEGEEERFEPEVAVEADQSFKPTEALGIRNDELVGGELAGAQTPVLTEGKTVKKSSSTTEPSPSHSTAESASSDAAFINSSREHAAGSAANVEPVQSVETAPVSFASPVEEAAVHQPVEAAQEPTDAQSLEVQEEHDTVTASATQAPPAEVTQVHILEANQNREASVLELTPAQAEGTLGTAPPAVADVLVVPHQPQDEVGVVVVPHQPQDEDQPEAGEDLHQQADDEEQSTSEAETNHDIAEDDDEVAVAKRDAAILSRLEARNKDRGWAFRPSRLMSFGLGRKRAQSEATGGFGWRSVNRQDNSDSSSDEEEEEEEVQHEQHGEDRTEKSEFENESQREPEHELQQTSQLQHQPELQHQRELEQESAVPRAVEVDPETESDDELWHQAEHKFEARAEHQVEEQFGDSRTTQPQNEQSDELEHQDQQGYQSLHEHDQLQQQAHYRNQLRSEFESGNEGDQPGSRSHPELPHEFAHHPELNPEHQPRNQPEHQHEHLYQFGQQTEADPGHQLRSEPEPQHVHQQEFAHRSEIDPGHENQHQHEQQHEYGYTQMHQESQYQQMFDNSHFIEHQQSNAQEGPEEQHGVGHQNEMAEGEGQKQESELTMQPQLSNTAHLELDSSATVAPSPRDVAGVAPELDSAVEVLHNEHSPPPAPVPGEAVSSHHISNESFDDAEDDRGSDGFSSVPETSVTTHIDQLTAMLGALGTEQSKYSEQASEHQSMRPEASHVPQDAIQEDEAEMTFVEARTRSMTRGSSSDEHDQIQFALDALQPPGGYQPLHDYEHDDLEPTRPLGQHRADAYEGQHTFRDSRGAYPVNTGAAYGEEMEGHHDAISLEGDDRTSRPISSHGRGSMLADGAFLGVASESDHAWTPISGTGSTPFEFDEYEAVSDDDAEEPEETQRDGMGHGYQVHDAGHLNHGLDTTPTLSSAPTLEPTSHADQTVFLSGPHEGIAARIAPHLEEEDDRDETDSGNAHWAQILQQSSRFSTSSLGHFESAKDHMSVLSQEPSPSVPHSPTIAVAPQH